jgi:polyhydroxybutyrate depolymerase
VHVGRCGLLMSVMARFVVTLDGCKGGADVNLCTVTGGGHTWPGGEPVPALGHTTTDIVATDAMWDFFLRHPLP